MCEDNGNVCKDAGNANRCNNDTGNFCTETAANTCSATTSANACVSSESNTCDNYHAPGAANVCKPTNPGFTGDYCGSDGKYNLCKHDGLDNTP
jgi:hypothetical protein